MKKNFSIPKSMKIVKKTKKFCIDTTFAYPLAIKDGKGCYIQSVDNKWYLDFNSNVASCNVGYKHPEIMEVLKKYSKIGIYKIAGQDFYCEEQAELAEKLIKITPKSLRKVFLNNTGAEAVENAIKFVFRKKGPLPGVSCTDAFHGRTLGALTFTDSKAVQKKNYPEINHETIKFCMKNDDPRINDLEELIRRESPPAFVIVECVQGEGGYRPGSKKFIKKLRSTTKKYGIALITDEIQSGMGRTGKWWSFEDYGIVPDIISAGKSLKVGATITSEKYDPNERGSVSSTWAGGHRIDMAIGLKTIEIIEKQKLMENAKEKGKYFIKRLSEIKEQFDDITDVRGLGLMVGIEFSTKKIKDFVEQEAFKNNLLLLGCGEKTIRIAPPLIIRKSEVDEGLNILDDVLRKLN